MRLASESSELGANEGEAVDSNAYFSFTFLGNENGPGENRGIASHLAGNAMTSHSTRALADLGEAQIHFAGKCVWRRKFSLISHKMRSGGGFVQKQIGKWLI